MNALLLLVLITLNGIFLPILKIGIASSAELKSPLLVIIGVACVVALVFLLSSWLVVRFSKGGVSRVVTGITLGISFGIYIQSNILPWHYGLMDGSEFLNADNFWLILSLVVWLCCLLVATYLVQKKHYRIVVVTLIIMCVGQIVEAGRQYIEKPVGFGYLELSSENKFAIGKRNILIFVVDSVSSNILQKALNKSSVTKILKDFTWYKNHQGNYVYTSPSIQVMLTSNIYNNSVEMGQYLKESYASSESLKHIVENYQTRDVFTDTAFLYGSKDVFSNVRYKKPNPNDFKKLLKVYAFIVMPDAIKKYFWLNYAQLNNEIEVRHINSEATNKDYYFYKELKNSGLKLAYDSSFKYYHLQGAHPKLELDENINIYNRTNKNISERKIDQAVATLQIIGEYLERLKAENVYDNSIVAIVGDHGPEMDLNMSYYLPPVLLIKDRNANQDKITKNDAVTQVADIIKIIVGMDIENKEVLNKLYANKERLLYVYNTFDRAERGYLPPLKKFVNRNSDVKPENFTLDCCLYSKKTYEMPYRDVKLGTLISAEDIIQVDLSKSAYEKPKLGLQNVMLGESVDGLHVNLTNGIAKIGFSNNEKAVQIPVLFNIKPIIKDANIKISANGVGLPVLYYQSDSAFRSIKLANASNGRYQIDIKGESNEIYINPNNSLISSKVFATLNWMFVGTPEDFPEIIYPGNIEFKRYLGNGWGPAEVTHRWCYDKCEVLVLAKSKLVNALILKTLYPLDVNNIKIKVNGKDLDLIDAKLIKDGNSWITNIPVESMSISESKIYIVQITKKNADVNSSNSITPVISVQFM